MPLLDVTIRHIRALIDYDTAGEINAVTLEAELLIAGIPLPGGRIRKTYSRDAAVAAGVTGPQAAAFKDAVATLRGDWQQSLLGP